MQELEVEQIRDTLDKHGYQYKSILGDGGSSNAFLCQRNQNIFVIKKSMKLQMIENEYKNLTSLVHPSIIKLYDSFEDELDEYLVIEYCSNGTLFQKGKLTYSKFVLYAKQILEAIAFCHSKKIAIRDINPEKIFIDQYDHIKLSNFGMAKEFESNEKSNEKCGSLFYLAPEMFQKQDVCPFKADIWSLGITFFFMATGSFPFKSSSIEKIKQMIIRGDIDYSEYDINPKIRFLLTKMLCKNKDNRFTAEKLLELPIFSIKQMKLPMLNFERRHTKPEIPKMLFTEDKSYDIAHCHTYRDVNLGYSRIHRVNNRFMTFKTFQ